MEVEIISQEIIRPSSPTPDHLKFFKRSLIDQIFGGPLVRFISFYPRTAMKAKTTEMLSDLKISLSEMFTLYYPLGGIGKDSSTVDCNDQGALFVTAQVNCAMEGLIGSQPKFEMFHKLGTSSKFSEDGEFQISVQFNEFACGGIAIYFCFSHRVADATTISAFLKSWATIAHGSRETIISPEYKSALLFPARETVPATLSPVIEKLLLKEGKSNRRRFVFSAASILALKGKARSKHVPDPTRVEVVSSFIWKHAMAAAKAVCGVQSPSMLIQAADLRRLMIPPLSDCCFGNVCWLIITDEISDAEDAKHEMLVQLLRMSKLKSRDEFVPQLQSTDGGYKAMCKFTEELKEKCSKNYLNLYQFTSWCKMGLNEVDFGWGKPIWTSLVGGTQVESIFKNIVVLVDGGSGDEIEAWLILDQREMAVLERNEDFLAYASPNPRIILC